MNRYITEDKFQAKIDDLHARYTDVFKPLLATVEVELEELPAAILNEIRSYNDHLSRCYWPDVDAYHIEDNITKAEGHLKRAELDCFKHLLVYYHDNCVRFMHIFRNVDLTLISNGEFYITYKLLWKEAVANAREAKLEETKNPDISYGYYQDAFNSWLKLDCYLNDHLPETRRAKVKSNFGKGFRLIGWLVAAVIGGMVSVAFELIPGIQQLMIALFQVFGISK